MREERLKKERLGSVYIMAKGLRCEVRGVKSKGLFRCDPRSYRQSAEMLGSCRQCMDGWWGETEGSH